MDITILQGSPRSPESTGREYINFIIKRFPRHTFTVFPVGSTTGRLETQNDYLPAILEHAGKSDCLLWVTPVYLGLVPGQLKRFIELLFKSEKKALLKGKYTSLLLTSSTFSTSSTSKVSSGTGIETAINYMQAVCDDLKMIFVESFAVNPFTAPGNPSEAEFYKRTIPLFASHLFNARDEREVTPVRFQSPFRKKMEYLPGKVIKAVSKEKEKAVILIDRQPGPGNLLSMIEVFRFCLPYSCEVVVLEETVREGCRGCFECPVPGGCGLDDGFNNLVEKLIPPASFVIFAGTVEDRFLSALFKYFFDRLSISYNRCLTGKQTAFLISGNLLENHTIESTLKAALCHLGANLAGIVTDENPGAEHTTKLLDSLARRMARYYKTGYKNSCYQPSYVSEPEKLLTGHPIYTLLSLFTKDKKKLIRKIIKKEHQKLQKMLDIE